VKPTVICLTPVRNEAWILNRFLKCASIWADHIIIADQNSDDGSATIAQAYPKVRLIRNNATNLCEQERVQMLLEESRKIQGPRLIIALDADEILTGNFLESNEWQTILNSRKGTLIRFDWANINPGITSCWLSENRVFGFMDDGSQFQGSTIHSPRVPTPASAPSLILKDIKVMHYQYTDWSRMQSKHRWYQCWELVNNPGRSPIDLYRMYHHMYSVTSNEICPIQSSWMDAYTAQAIDMTSTLSESVYWWDKAVLLFIREYGAHYFSKLNIWDFDWADLAQREGLDDTEMYRDPRNRIEKNIHKFLHRSQACKPCHRFSDTAIKMLPQW